MADVEFDGFVGNFDTNKSSSMASRSARIFGMAGAATSLALVVGLGYWGYSLAVRDITGIPVVRAMEGPMRSAPEDPGGVIASHQGLSVNSVADQGGIAAPGDRLTLAPAPVSLTEDDLTGAAIAQVAPGSSRISDMPGLSPLPVDDVPAALLTISLDDGSPTPLSADPDVALRSDPAPVYDLPKGAIAQSPRPRARPGMPDVLASAPVTPEIAGETLASGTRLVQLGAFDSQEVARDEWDRLAGKFGDLLAGKTRVVQSAQSAGRTFYRLRALGFSDEADQRRFCSALVAERAACIPVAVR
jgi:hypothetical protein